MIFVGRGFSRDIREPKTKALAAEVLLVRCGAIDAMNSMA